MTVQDLAPIAQLPLPLTWQVAPGIDAVPAAPRHLRLVATAPAGSSDSGSNDSGPNDSGPKRLGAQRLGTKQCPAHRLGSPHGSRGR